MAPMQTAVLVLMLVGCALAQVDWKASANAFQKLLGDDDKGHAENCGDAKHNFTLEWSPKDLNFDQKHSVTINFDMTPVEDWSSGKACITVNLDPYQEPIYQGCKDADCNMINPYVPGACPFKAQKAIKLSKSIPLTTPIPIPPSDYKIKVEVQTASGGPFICGQAVLHVVDSYKN